MLFTTSTRIFLANTAPKPLPPQLFIGFDGTKDTYFRNSVIAINLTDVDDLQELDLLWQITGVTGEVKWESELIGKRVRLIVDVVKVSRTEIKVIPYAIGQKKDKSGDDDHFIVLNSKRELVTEEKAMELITNELQKKTNH